MVGTDRSVEGLHPSYQPIVSEVLVRAPRRGIYPFITQGRRSPEYQACLWAQGRVPIGEASDVEDLTVHVIKSEDGLSAMAICGKTSNLVPLKKWGVKVTQVGPYGSWHVFGLATDFSFRTRDGIRDDFVAQIEDAIRIARSGGDVKRAAKLYGLLAEKYRTLAEVFNEVAPDAIWGNDWDDDGVENGPDPDNEWTDLPHFEWHPGIVSIKWMTPEQRERVIAGETPMRMKPCAVCGKFTAELTDGVCAECHRNLAAPSSAPRVGVK